MGSDLFLVPLVIILESVSIAKSFGKSSFIKLKQKIVYLKLYLNTARGARVDASQEMIALGVSNVMGSFVSSFPVTGSFSRTAVNNASGVHTPLSGIFTGNKKSLKQ